MTAITINQKRISTTNSKIVIPNVILYQVNDPILLSRKSEFQNFLNKFNSLDVERYCKNKNISQAYNFLIKDLYEIRPETMKEYDFAQFHSLLLQEMNLTQEQLFESNILCFYDFDHSIFDIKGSVIDCCINEDIFSEIYLLQSMIVKTENKESILINWFRGEKPFIYVSENGHTIDCFK